MSELVKSPNQSPVPAGAFHETLRQVLETPVKSKPYTAQVTRSSPSAFVFLIDQSGSMKQQVTYLGKPVSKAEAVARIVNEILQEIINRCQKSDGVRDYFDIAVIGYGQDDTADFAWEGALQGRKFVAPSELAANYLSVETVVVQDVVRGVPMERTKHLKQWITPKADALTPMKNALEKAADLLEAWLVDHRAGDHFPPLVLNITDGAATDGKAPDLLAAARRIKNLHTTDGHVLLLNIHLSSAAGDPVLFPTAPDDLPDDPLARLLYDMSSEMPQVYHADIARLVRVDNSGYFTGMAFNADAKALISMLQIGTNTALAHTHDAARSQP